MNEDVKRYDATDNTFAIGIMAWFYPNGITVDIYEEDEYQISKILED